ncbi:hypothetical protein BJ742DRAFT_712603 [Cladochytrium replicatum]|nr:hypothetical protein BJ742DRAFT_712603 [Cladochytrium replicatum]
MLKFLRRTRRTWSKLHGKKGVYDGAAATATALVLGNESADLDSIVSAISFAYLKDTEASLIQTAARPLFVPVVSVPRGDLRLRTDCITALTWALEASKPNENDEDDIDFTSAESSLTFLDDIRPVLDSLEEGEKVDNLSVYLTDHNVLSPKLTHLDQYVSGVVDHHKDDRKAPEGALDPYEITTVGSCTTLVAERWAALVARTAQPMDPVLSRLMLAPILVDTINLSPSGGRVTDRDVAAAHFLKSQLPDVIDQTSFFTELFGRLQSAKFDVRGLASRDLLRKDYKEWVCGSFKLGISSVTWFLGDEQGINDGGWLARESEASGDGKSGAVILSGDLLSWANENSLDVAVIMTAFDHGGAGEKGFERELMVMFSENMRALSTGSVMDGVMEALRVDVDLKLKERQLHDVEHDWTKFFVQGDNKLSRKQVQPILQRILEGTSPFGQL